MPPPPATSLPSMAKQSTPKTMSSRLMTMKFMQRAAAASVISTPESTTSPATPHSDDGSAKRRKVSHAPSAAANGSPATPPLYDQKAIRAALEDEEKKREAAIQKRAAELGDSHWELPSAAALRSRASRPALSVVHVGFAQIDHATALVRGGDDGGGDPFDLGSVPAQTHIRRFNMKKSKACLRGAGPVKKEDDDSGGSDSDESGSGSESGEASEDERPPASAREEPGRGRRSTLGNADRKRARSSVSSRRDEERKKAQQLAGKRRKKEIKLNQLSSISSVGSQAFQRPSSTLTCHGCGKPGHKIADCPNKKR
ncbi:hypothetical protein N658DRAFT_528964 [Parathielavia hyrcaniae]|uniref:CCHC-type domain-containing protein n=1 Tax=Parathielavia hyrcaniae TaxID=113614 RepID=A0AAN6QCE3_9PEZI|nr:hypothetical protein N658DRAFT_528964 [Parathielavia hyrcaniae]